jgi:hypothetical protein
MHRRVAAVALLTVSAWAVAVAQGPEYRARLSVVPIDIAMQSSVAGSGSVTATLKGRTLVLNGTFTGLITPATVVRLHRGPRLAMRGPAIGDLTATAATSGTITGSLELSPEQAADLAAGRLYVQLHSEKAPEGNLWGWLLAAEARK